ncbi:MAG: hypothetical protein HKN28_10850, partial [Alphaproteobacteria bacterium]|nr:hypothetical protein [Alphaproteobacteria bacterium]
MPNENGPWEDEPEDEGSRSPTGWILWIVLLVAVGIGIWLISTLLPGRISSDRDSQIEIVRLVALLALVSSGLIFARQINLGEVVRNISI